MPGQHLIRDKLRTRNSAVQITALPGTVLLAARMSLLWMPAAKQRLTPAPPLLNLSGDQSNVRLNLILSQSPTWELHTPPDHYLRNRTLYALAPYTRPLTRPPANGTICS